MVKYEMIHSIRNSTHYDSWHTDHVTEKVHYFRLFHGNAEIAQAMSPHNTGYGLECLNHISMVINNLEHQKPAKIILQLRKAMETIGMHKNVKIFKYITHPTKQGEYFDFEELSNLIIKGLK